MRVLGFRVWGLGSQEDDYLWLRAKSFLKLCIAKVFEYPTYRLHGGFFSELPHGTLNIKWFNCNGNSGCPLDFGWEGFRVCNEGESSRKP